MRSVWARIVLFVPSNPADEIASVDEAKELLETSLHWLSHGDNGREGDEGSEGEGGSGDG